MYISIKIYIEMKKWLFSAFFSLFLVLGAGLSAQSAPYVTQIKAEARNNLIRLTWTDSADAKGPVYIYRSTRPFSGIIPANIRPVAVRYGDQYYIDDTDDIENLYYFIAASDISGQRYEIILPGINSTSPVAQLNSDYLSSASSVLASIQTAPAEGIYNLMAAQDGERIIITFDSSGDFGRNAILYRSTHPVSRPQDLLNAVIVQPSVRSPFIDMPVPGFNFFYTIIYEDEISSGNMGIKPGINATITAVAVFSDENQERSIRPIPLPVMTLNSAMSDSFFITEIPGQIPLSSESALMLRDTKMPQKEPLELKRPRVFAVDLAAPQGGEESALFQIVMEYFSKYDWDSARISLQYYLSLPRSREVEARARFYLGQTLYYTGKFREALMEFLAFRSHNATEANSWIEATLAAMVY
jgi:hypothetical protein